MSMIVETIDDSNFKVNGKLVFKDANGKWIHQGEFYTAETRAAQAHIIALENQQV